MLGTLAGLSRPKAIHEIFNAIRAYMECIVDLEGDKRMRYVLIFKNHGEEAGAHTISHSISQLMALSVTGRHCDEAFN